MSHSTYKLLLTFCVLGFTTPVFKAFAAGLAPTKEQSFEYLARENACNESLRDKSRAGTCMIYETVDPQRIRACAQASRDVDERFLICLRHVADNDKSLSASKIEACGENAATPTDTFERCLLAARIQYVTDETLSSCKRSEWNLDFISCLLRKNFGWCKDDRPIAEKKQLFYEELSARLDVKDAKTISRDEYISGEWECYARLRAQESSVPKELADAYVACVVKSFKQDIKDGQEVVAAAAFGSAITDRRFHAALYEAAAKPNISAEACSSLVMKNYASAWVKQRLPGGAGAPPDQVEGGNRAPAAGR
jgi:hypothetical protein